VCFGGGGVHLVGENPNYLTQCKVNYAVADFIQQ